MFLLNFFIIYGAVPTVNNLGNIKIRWVNASYKFMKIFPEGTGNEIPPYAFNIQSLGDGVMLLLSTPKYHPILLDALNPQITFLSTSIIMWIYEILRSARSNVKDINLFEKYFKDLFKMVPELRMPLAKIEIKDSLKNKCWQDHNTLIGYLKRSGILCIPQS